MFGVQNPPRNGEGGRRRRRWWRGPASPQKPGCKERRGPSATLRMVPLPVPGRIKEAGFTLVEMMVVIVIIGLLATIVIINVMPAADRAAVTKARADIATMEQAVEMYRLNAMRYPTSDEGLQALVAAQHIRRLPNDPWGRAYRYAAPGANGQPFTISTLGADGREGGDGENADIAN